MAELIDEALRGKRVRSYTYGCAVCGQVHTAYLSTTSVDNHEADDLVRAAGWVKTAAGWTHRSCVPKRGAADRRAARAEAHQMALPLSPEETFDV